MSSNIITNPKSNLLYHQDEQQEDSYFSANKPSYYKRSNLLVQSSFRQKYKGFRTRSSSYTSLDDDKTQNNGLLNYQDIPPPLPSSTTNNNTSLFSRKRLGMTTERSTTTAPTTASYFSSTKQDFDEQQEDEDDEDSDENTFFAKKNSYSRRNLSRSPFSWKSCVLRAVGVKSR